MPIETALHALLQPEGRFIAAPGMPGRAFKLAPMMYGDKLPVRVFAWNQPPMQPGQVTSEDLSDYYVELTVGSRNETPNLGFFTIAFDGGAASNPISVTATAFLVQIALSQSSVTVTGVPGNLVITSTAVGARSLPVVTFSGDVEVGTSITQVNPGSATEFAQWRLEFPEMAPAIVASDAWTVGSTMAVCSADAVPNTSNHVWRITIDSSAVGGFFRLSVGNTLTGFIPLGSSPAEVQAALRGLPGAAQGCIVTPGGPSGCAYVVALTATAEMDVNGWGLSVPFSLHGVLDLSTDGIRDLLGEHNTAEAYLTLAVYDAATATLLTFAQSSVVVAMPVSRPTDHGNTPNTSELQYIDLPDMQTGLWHRVTLAGTNAAPTFAIDTDGEVFTGQQGPIFIADENNTSVYVLVIYGGSALMVFAVKAQGLPTNASFQPRKLALASPEDNELFCTVGVEPPELPNFAEPANLVIGEPV